MTDLITLEEFKEYKSKNNPTDDGKIQSLITKVSALTENYCSRTFLDFATSGNAIVEWHDAYCSEVYLKNFPVIDVISVYTSPDGGLTQTALVEAATNGTGYFVDYDSGMLRTQYSNKGFLTTYNTPYRSLEVIYTAGYTNLPEDLKLCVIDMVDYYYDQQKSPTKSMLGATIDNPLPYIANSFPPHIRRILDLYRYSP